MDTVGVMFETTQPQKLNKVTTTAALSPIALLTLAACGSGGGGGV